MISVIRAILFWLTTLALVATGFWWASRRCERAAAPGRTVITWMSYISPLRDLYEQEVAEFERLHPELAVCIIWVPANEYHMKFKTLTAAGQSPDLFFAGDVWMTYLQPFMADLTPLVERDAAEIGLDDYFPEIRSAMLHEGRYRVLPESMNISLCYYNRRLFREAGLAEPTEDWTWDDIIRAGRRLTRPAEGNAPAVWGCSRLEGWWGEWLIYVRQAGGAVFTPDGRRCLLDSAAAIEGLRFYREKSSRHGISASAGFEPPNSFVNERVAMNIGGHLDFWLNYNAVPGLDWDVQLLPSGPAGRAGGEIAIGGYSLSKTTPHPEAAWALMKHLTRKESVAAIVARGGVAVRRSVAEAQLRDPGRKDRPRNLAAVYRQLEFARPIPRHPHYIEIMLQIVQPEVDRMVLGELTPEETGRRAAAAANAFLDVFNSPTGSPEI